MFQITDYISSFSSSLQTFAIPGSIFLSIMSGYLFPFYLALTLVCFCSAAGASLCYLLSYLVGTKLVNRFAKERAQSWATKVRIISSVCFEAYSPL